jgi:ABC-2 type transport system permease protein
MCQPISSATSRPRGARRWSPSIGLSDSLTAAVQRAVVPGAPKAPRIRSLVAETIVLVNPERNYAQFLLRTLLPMVIQVIIAISSG